MSADAWSNDPSLRSLLQDVVSPEVIETLEKSQVTVDSLLSPTCPRLAAFTLNNPAIFKPSELTALRLHVAKKLAAPGARADKELASIKATIDNRPLSPGLQTGITSLDDLLRGAGFQTHTVSEISGSKRSGKTGLAMRIVLYRFFMHPHHSTLWIDTAGNFSPERADAMVCRILQERKADGIADTDSLRMSAMEQLRVALCFDLATLRSTLLNLRDHLKISPPSMYPCLFVVIDSITPLLSPYLTSGSAQGHATMCSIMQELNVLAREHSLTVLVINDAVKTKEPNPESVFDQTMHKPALGPSFTYLTDQTVWLARAEQVLPKDMEGVTHSSNALHVAEVMRSRSKMSKVWSIFSIVDGVDFENVSPPKLS